MYFGQLRVNALTWERPKSGISTASAYFKAGHKNKNKISIQALILGQRSSLVVSTIASNQEGPGFEPGAGPLCVEFTCSSCACAAFLWEL